jgi:hypothetical protein
MSDTEWEAILQAGRSLVAGRRTERSSYRRPTGRWPGGTARRPGRVPVAGARTARRTSHTAFRAPRAAQSIPHIACRAPLSAPVPLRGNHVVRSGPLVRSGTPGYRAHYSQDCPMMTSAQMARQALGVGADYRHILRIDSWGGTRPRRRRWGLLPVRPRLTGPGDCPVGSHVR